MFYMTSMNFVLSRWFAGLVLIEIGKPFCSTATCIFVPEILLNPSYPILSPLFWQRSMRSQLIFFGGQSCLACVRILLVWREFFSIFLFVVALGIEDVQWILNRTCLACLPICIRYLTQTIFRLQLSCHHILDVLFWQVLVIAAQWYSIGHLRFLYES